MSQPPKLVYFRISDKSYNDDSHPVYAHVADFPDLARTDRLRLKFDKNIHLQPFNRDLCRSPWDGDAVFDPQRQEVMFTCWGAPISDDGVRGTALVAKSWRIGTRLEYAGSDDTPLLTVKAEDRPSWWQALSVIVESNAINIIAMIRNQGTGEHELFLGRKTKDRGWVTIPLKTSDQMKLGSHARVVLAPSIAPTYVHILVRGVDDSKEERPDDKFVHLYSLRSAYFNDLDPGKPIPWQHVKIKFRNTLSIITPLLVPVQASNPQQYRLYFFELVKPKEILISYVPLRADGSVMAMGDVDVTEIGSIYLNREPWSTTRFKPIVWEGMVYILMECGAVTVACVCFIENDGSLPKNDGWTQFEVEYAVHDKISNPIAGGLILVNHSFADF